MSHRRTLLKIDECGKDFDSVAKQWKQDSEKSCKRKIVLDTIHEVVDAAEKECVPPGFETVDVGQLNLSFPSVNMMASSAGSVDLNVSKPNLDGDNLQKRVKAKLKDDFDEPAFLHVLKMFSCTEEITTEAIEKLQVELELMHAAGYQITGDNVDLFTKVKHQSTTNQNKSIHWFNLNATLNRVLGNELPNDKPIGSVRDIENIEFLPSQNDNGKLLQDLIALVSRVITSQVPAFKNLKSATVWHIPHRYSETMKCKSEQVCNVN